MTTTENIRDIFSILHDGTIAYFSGDKKLLTLIVDCSYLAQRIDKSFDNFYVDLIGVKNISLTTWPNPTTLPSKTLTEMKDIFEAQLEILSADIKADNVIVSCGQYDTSYNYSGGNLTINCEAIKIYDQNKNELTIDNLDAVCKSYWDEFSKKE